MSMAMQMDGWVWDNRSQMRKDQNSRWGSGFLNARMESSDVRKARTYPSERDLAGTSVFGTRLPRQENA